MAKRKPQSQRTVPANKLNEINQLFANAEPENDSPPIFANQVQITASAEEIIIDFYRAGPKRGNTTSEIHIDFVQRIIMPPTAAARFAEVFSDLFKTINQDNSGIPE